MEIDWRVITVIVIGYFAVNGFLRGWWKEAVTTIFLTVLLILLLIPDLAALIIEAINNLIAAIIDLLPVTVSANSFQIDPTSPGTWVVILILFLGLAALIARSTLPSGFGGGQFYAAGPTARLLGLAIGAINGFLALNLVREYLDGRSLPGNELPANPELTLATSGTFGPPTTAVTIQASDLPSFTILDSFIPWLLIGLGLLLFITAIRNRIIIASHPDGGRKIDFPSPYGYRRT
ncbi:MAG: hypothetical protein R3264_18085 [Anaerolineae bacterium]|nr:hypothetical protein [Anaerolineae bacterium]